MRLVLKTKIQKLSFLVVVVSIAIIILFVLKLFILGAIILCALIIMIVVWYRMLGEELFVYDLKRNSYRLPFKKIIGDMKPEKGMAVIKRLEKKGIVKFENGTVHLLKRGRITAFEERMKQKKRKT